MTDKFSFAIPVIRPFWREEELIQLHEDLISDIKKWGGNLAFENEYFLPGSQLKISIQDSDNNLLNTLVRPHPVRDYRLMVIEVAGHLNSVAIENAISSIPEDDLNDALITYCKRDIPLTTIGLEIQNFFLISNISFPGALSTEPGIGMASDEKITDFEGFYAESLYYASRFTQKLKWPRMLQISIIDAWNWLNNTNCVKSGVGENSLGRAIAAFSRVIKRNYRDDSSLDIVWALLGLEALYSKGNVGLKEQLVSKTEVLLGTREENKRAFGKMYDFRSRLLHGDIDIPLSYSPYDATPAFESFHADLYQSEEIAITTLIATFQQMIKNNWKELDFVYSLQGGEASSI